MRPMIPTSVPGTVIVALAFVGVAIGLFAGMSESAVGAALVAGLFGLIGGGGIYTLFGQPKERLPSFERMHDLSLGVVALCVASILSAFVGIALRQGLLPWPQANSASAKAPLLEISRDLQVVPRGQYLKLLLLQLELENLGVPREENNRLVGALIANSSSAKDFHSAYVGDVLGYARDVSAWNQGVLTESLSSLSAELRRSVSDASGKPRTQRVEELERTLREAIKAIDRATATSRGIGGSAEKLETSVRAAVQPEVAVLLDLVARYRQAAVDSPEPRILTPAWRRSGSSRYEEAFKPSIKE